MWEVLMAKIKFVDERIRSEHPEVFRNDPTLGGLAMEQVLDLGLYNTAQSFVNMHEEKGREAALLWFVSRVGAEDQIKAAPYIKVAFEKIGYRFK
jgi:uncharacterized protein HemY